MKVFIQTPLKTTTLYVLHTHLKWQTFLKYKIPVVVKNLNSRAFQHLFSSIYDPHDVIALHPTALDAALNDKVKKGTKRKRVVEDTVETAKRRSARVRNTKCKKEEKIDFQELLLKFLPSRCLFNINIFRGLVPTCCDHIKQCTRRHFVDFYF